MKKQTQMLQNTTRLFNSSMETSLYQYVIVMSPVRTGTYYRRERRRR
jgi:hypothetical protein